ncbi:MAG: hypothetical protein IJX30_03205 [Clostridia bacterium]|nr:hypothetical protein [Clostridia bacterium]
MLYEIDSPQRQSRTIRIFGGLNTTCNAGENEFVKELNLSADSYPALSPAGGRHGEYIDLHARILGALYVDGVYYVRTFGQGARLCKLDGGIVDGGTTDEAGFLLNTQEKTMVNIGAYIAIFPDKVLYDMRTKTFEYMEAQFFAQNCVYEDDSWHGTNTLGLCAYPDEEARKLIERNDFETAPPTDQSDALFYSVGKNGAVTYYTFDSYAGVGRRYAECKPLIRIYSSIQTAFDRFKVGDIVKILHENGKESSAEVLSIHNEGLTDRKDNATDDWATSNYEAYMTLSNFELYEAGTNEKLGYAFLSGAGTLYGTIMATSFTVRNEIPDMDFVIENNNRLWGCSSATNEIYACALGNPRSWRDYSGISTDSYAVSCGVYGDFTGAAVYGGTPIFFKDWCMLRVYGSYPAAFQVKRTECPGIEAGSSASAAICGGVLYYKSFDGIYGFDGTYPQKVSDALNGLDMKNVAAGARGSKYYLFADIGQERRLFCYDIKKGMFHEQTAALGDGVFVLSSINGVYSIASSDRFSQICILDARRANRGVEWYGVTGDFGMDSAAFQYPVRIAVRFSCEYAFTIEIAYDEQDRFDTLLKTDKTSKGIAYRSCPIRRCNMFRLRFSGVGDFRLYSVDIVTETAGESNHGKL